MKANNGVEKNSESTFILKMKTGHTYLNSTEKLKGKTGKCYIGEIFTKD